VSITDAAWGALRGGPGVAVAAWQHVSRLEPVYRTESDRLTSPVPSLPAALVTDADLQAVADGFGPLFHRRYRAHAHDALLSPEQLIDTLLADLNAAVPRHCMWFETPGPGTALAMSDDVHIRLAGPWDAPVRVAGRTPKRFAFATRRGHPEAGQIEFRAGHVRGVLTFEIQSWARSANAVADLLYDRMLVTRELQTHMWVHFCRRAVTIAGGVGDAVAVHTERVASAGRG